MGYADEQLYQRRCAHLISDGAPLGRRRDRPPVIVKLPPFEYASPATLAEAVSLLAAGRGTAKVLAGGQSLLPTMAFRLATPSLLVDIRKLKELQKIAIAEDGVRLGARARWRDIEDDERLKSAQPLLC